MSQEASSRSLGSDFSTDPFLGMKEASAVSQSRCLQLPLIKKLVPGYPGRWMSCQGQSPPHWLPRPEKACTTPSNITLSNPSWDLGLELLFLPLLAPLCRQPHVFRTSEQILVLPPGTVPAVSSDNALCLSKPEAPFHTHSVPSALVCKAQGHNPSTEDQCELITV